MNKYIKKHTLPLAVMSFFVLENGNASNELMPVEDGIFGISKNHITLGRSNTVGRSEITVETRDQAGESDLARMLNSLAAAGLIGRLEVRMEVSDKVRLSNAANDAFEEGDHKKAFDWYGILVAINPKDHIAKYHLANYLIHGISGAQEPNEQDRFRACQLLIETSWIEMTEHPDEPDNGGRLIQAYKPEVYTTLSRRVTEKLPLEDGIKEILQVQLFEEIKDQPADPF
jgi:hypothetical protein